MEKITLKLEFNTEFSIFTTDFNKIPREFIYFLKKKYFLEKITGRFIEEFPETFNGYVIIHANEIVNTKNCYNLLFYTLVQATENMKISAQKYLSRDIKINDKDDYLEFSILISKDSEYITIPNDQEIIFNFSD